MIYVGKVRPSIMEKPIDMDVIEFFKNYKPPEHHVSDDEAKQTELKTIYIDGVIIGKMSKIVRKNENLISRNCLILDLDDVIVSEDELIKSIHARLEKLEYVLYPSISHGLKGIRYRLLIPMDQSLNQQEYTLLLEFFLTKLFSKILGSVDQSNYTWAQIMLLPCLTQYVSQDKIIINQGEQKLSVDSVLKNIRTTDSKVTNRKFKNANQYKKGGSRYRNTTTELFESLVIGCQNGNRNNRIAQITGGLLTRAVNVDVVLELVKIANSYFDEPLPVKEVEATFYSIAKKELMAH